VFIGKSHVVMLVASSPFLWFVVSVVSRVLSCFLLSLGISVILSVPEISVAVCKTHGLSGHVGMPWARINAVATVDLTDGFRCV
jgi:hypothetical protein